MDTLRSRVLALFILAISVEIFAFSSTLSTGDVGEDCLSCELCLKKDNDFDYLQKTEDSRSYQKRHIDHRDVTSPIIGSPLRSLSQSEPHEPRSRFLNKSLVKTQDCSLNSETIASYLDNDTRIWTLTDEALNVIDNDLQVIVNCSQEGDTVLFNVSKTLKIHERVILPWKITFDTEAFRHEEIARAKRTVLTCSGNSDGLFLIEKGATFENVVFKNCALSKEGSAIVKATSCDADQRKNTVRLRHVRFVANVFTRSRPLDMSGSCMSLEMKDVKFLENECRRGDCGLVLSPKNDLFEVTIKGNVRSDVSNKPAIFYAPPKSTTLAKRIEAKDNNGTIFFVDGGDLILKDSRFIRNRWLPSLDDSKLVEKVENTLGDFFKISIEIISTGACVFANNSNVTVTDSVFKNNTAQRGTGLHLESCKEVIVKNTTFTQNEANEGEGGGILGKKTKITLEGCVMKRNRAENGGAIQMQDGNLSVKNGTFLSNTAYESGGAIFAENNENVLFSEIQCIKNSAYDNGGCLYLNTSTVMIDGAKISYNTAPRGGGCYVSSIGKVEIIRSHFLGNSAYYYGGGLMLSQVKTSTLTSTHFIQNKAYQSGGLEVRQGKHLLEDVSFDRNKAEYVGGGFSCSEGADVISRRSVFERNKGQEYGGGFYATTACSLDLTDSNWISNIAIDGGGGALDNARGNFVNVSFVQHRDEKNDYGAALYSRISIVTFRDALFQDNKAKRGGVMSLSKTNGTFTNCQLIENKSGHGGALWIQDNSRFKVYDTTFKNNVADELGGCLCSFDGSRGVFKDTKFINNIAGNSGGCFYSYNTTLDLENVEIIGNSAKLTGGGMELNRCHVNISNSTLSNNHAEFYGGGFEVSFSLLFLKNTTIKKCKANEDGGGFFIEREANVSLEDCSLIGNYARDNGGAVFMNEESRLIGIRLILMNNNASALGGGISAIQSSKVDLSASLFVSQNAREGGALALQSNAFAKIQNSKFMTNSATYNGADIYSLEGSLTLLDSSTNKSGANISGASIFGSSSSIKIRNSNFTSCKAFHGGGSIAAINGTSLSIKSATFLKSNATFGGAIFVEESDFIGKHLKARKCEAKVDGGVVFALSPTALTCRKCKFEESTAKEKGGALAIVFYTVEHLVMILDKSKFIGNKAALGGALHFIDRAASKCEQTQNCTSLLLCGTTFEGNHAISGGAILTDHLNTILVDCNCKTPKRTSLSDRKLKLMISGNSFQQSCSNWKNNTATKFGRHIASYGHDVVMTVTDLNSGNTTMLKDHKLSIRGHRSGDQIPTLSCEVRDELGQGPASDIENSTIVATMSSQGLFTGSIELPLKNGKGVFSGVSGYQTKGQYHIFINFSDSALFPYEIEIEIRGCNLGEFQTQDGKYCEKCSQGTYNIFENSSNESCKPCPENGICEGSVPFPREGYYHSNPCSLHFQRCLSNHACNEDSRKLKLNMTVTEIDTCNFTESNQPLQVTNYSKIQCREGYEGLLCGSCSQKFTRAFALKCVRCSGIATSVIFLLISVLVLIILSGITVKGALPITVPQSNVENNAVDDSASEIKTAVPSKEPVNEEPIVLAQWRISEIVKIIINFLQVLSVAVSINVSWTDSLIRLFSILGSVSAMSTDGTALSVDCVLPNTPHFPRSIGRNIINVAIPLFVVTIHILLWTLSLAWSKQSRKQLFRRCLLSTLAILSLSYISISKTAINSIYCVKVYDSKEPFSDSSERYWTADTRFRCDDTPVLALAWTIGWPVLFYFTLGFPFVLGWAFVVERRYPGSLNHLVSDTAGFLYRAYRPSFIFWECVIMARKAALTTISVLSYFLGGNMQGLLCTCVLILAHHFQAVCSPFRDEFNDLNQLEQLSLVFSCLTFASSWIYNDNQVQQDARMGLTIGLIVFNVGLLFFFFLTLFRSFVVYLRKVLEKAKFDHDQNGSDLYIIKMSLCYGFRTVSDLQSVLIQFKKTLPRSKNHSENSSSEMEPDLSISIDAQQS